MVWATVLIVLLIVVPKLLNVTVLTMLLFVIVPLLVKVPLTLSVVVEGTIR
jgi:hypothetical protein